MANNALVVLVKDKKTFFKTYPEHSQSFSELTRFNSKAFDEIFTALSLLQLQEAEKINLRGDIANYKWKYDRNFKQNILIENLLTHTTGIQENIIYSNPERKREPDFNKNTSLVRFGEPNEFISYSADDLVILQTILQDAAGKSMKKTVAYIRVSTTRQLDGEGPQQQTRDIMAWALNTNSLIDQWVTEDETGTIADREEILKLKEQARAGELGTLVSA